MVNMAFSGFVIAFYAGFLHRIIERSIGSDASSDGSDASHDSTADGHLTQIINEKTSAVFICLGVCEFIAGVTSGVLRDKLSVS